jgi:regulator of sirC expression with transglutaminase-like and TPR domain
VYHEFSEATAGRDSDVDLFGAAMLIARLGDPEADPNAVARELDLVAEAVLEHAGGRDTQSLVNAINHELFEVRGFHGNSTSYNDPANSYLDRVVERRTGLPITLSLVYMEVAERVGLRCDGVGYPGHFLVRCGEPEEGVYVDPFHQGTRLDREELVARLRGQDLGGAQPESFLAACTRRQILQRMIRNLHLVFREQRDVERWMATVEFALCLEPWNAALVGERGMLHYRLGDHKAAVTDLKRYVEATPAAAAGGARRLLDELRLRTGGTEDE